ncbi:MAG: LTA synthase family protein [Bacteroidales bacterium]|nr:LTA synthase family protein [Bacteroidales bacterium]
MKRIFNYIKPYLFVAFCFLLAVILTKTIEAFAISTEIDFGTYMRSIATNLIASSITCICILPIFIAVNFLSKKGALLTTSILLSVVILAEISLAVYTAHNGTLLGSELLVRPASESFMAVKGAFGIFVPIISVIAIVAGFTTIVMLLSKLKVPTGIHIAALALILLSIPCSFFVPKLMLDDEAANNYISSRTYFLISDCIESTKSDSADYDTDAINAFLADNKDYLVLDPAYPFERIDKTPDNLSVYFNNFKGKPNIVILIVESLGYEFMNPHIVPFIDSIAKQGLYWKNCLSVSNRSFGAIPAITCSSTGPNGFQFGKMPDHNSLIKMLKSNGYQTNAFYAGYWTFDCIYEYLNAQGIDYMSPLWQEYKKIADKEEIGTEWGYYDNIMFDKTIEYLKQSRNIPKLNLIVTLSSHDKFSNKDKTQKKYIEKFDSIISEYGDDFCEAASKNKDFCATMLYVDESIKDFMTKYKELDGYENTIFVITGDHSSAITIKSKVDKHHVPLIIWSPMLNSNKEFSNIVTHNDIAPSLTTLLKNKYDINAPSTTHYIGNGLITDKKNSHTQKLLIATRDKSSKQMVYGDYFIDIDQYESTRIYKIDDQLNLTIVADNDLLKEKLTEKLYNYRDIVKYTYTNNRITKKQWSATFNIDTLECKTLDEELTLKHPENKPSEVGREICKIFPPFTLDANMKYKNIRISLDATIILSNDRIDAGESFSLEFTCYNSKNPILCSENVLMAINDDNIKENTPYKISLSKDFQYDKDVVNFYILSIATTNDDIWWNPNYQIKITDATYLIEGLY